MLLGYAVLHFFEHTVVGHLHFGEETHREVMISPVASISTFTGLFIHAFFDGFAISAGMQFNFYLGLLVFFAVLLHKIPEGLTIATVMLAADAGADRVAGLRGNRRGDDAGHCERVPAGGGERARRGDRVRVFGGDCDVRRCKRPDPGDQSLQKPDHSAAGVRGDAACSTHGTLAIGK